MWRPWTEIDWDAPRPTPEEIATSQARIEFTPAQVNSPAALRLIDTLRSLHINGGAHIAAFTVDRADDAAHWLFSRNRFEEYGFIEQLLTSDALASALPELLPINADLSQAGFAASSALILDGQIAGALVYGGPYRDFEGSHADAKRIGVEVCSELMSERYEDFRVDSAGGSWSEWFYQVAWDRTWILTDRRNERVTLICITDTD